MSNTLISRPKYIAELSKWKDQTDLVKIITGVRRCGKSKLCDLFQQYLKKECDVKQGQIIAVNLENADDVQKIGLSLDKSNRLTHYQKLLDYFKKKINPKQMNYVFIDEVQLLDNWQLVANALRLKGNVDVYLTGSNAYMFSSDLANSFGGRFVEIKIQPLSFKEFCEAYIRKTTSPQDPIRGNPLQEIYQQYTTISGFPRTLDFLPDQDMVKTYLMDTVYRNTLQKDIVARFKITDSSKLDAVTRFFFDNIGNETSIASIVKYLKNTGNAVSAPTINNYLQGLLDSYLLYKCDRYDIKGKQYLDSNAKYYVADIGLRTTLLGETDIDRGHALENIVYLELLRRGYKVSVGKLNVIRAGKRKTLEVDFVAEKAGGVREYYQVSWYALETDTLKRELTSLETIHDNYPKYLLTMDFGSGETNGIKRINVLDWLLSE